MRKPPCLESFVGVRGGGEVGAGGRGGGWVSKSAGAVGENGSVAGGRARMARQTKHFSGQNTIPSLV